MLGRSAALTGSEKRTRKKTKSDFFIIDLDSEEASLQTMPSSHRGATRTSIIQVEQGANADHPEKTSKMSLVEAPSKTNSNATNRQSKSPRFYLRACLKSQKASVIRPISEAEFESWPDRPRQRRWSLSFHSRERDGDDASANQKSFRQPIDGEAP